MLEEAQTQLSKKEFDFLKTSLDDREVPEPMLLLKDHKTTQPTPFRFVLPCKNFTASCAKLGFTAIKNLLVSEKVDFEKYTIKNSFDFLKKIKGLNLSRDTELILSVDAVQMYPSISLKMIKQAVFHYASGFDSGKFAKILWGLKLVGISMNSAVCQFAGSYYRYGGLNADYTDSDSVCLSIGSYESAFFSDLVINYVLEKVTEVWSSQFSKEFGGCKFLASFRDDGVLICENGKGKGLLWLERFQRIVNNLFEPEGSSSSLKFTVSEWTDETFEFLDAQLSWDASGRLQCKGFKKPNQEIRYLHAESSHFPASIRGIMKGVEKRLGRIFFSTDVKAYDQRFDEVYPNHAAQLEAA